MAVIPKENGARRSDATTLPEWTGIAHLARSPLLAAERSEFDPPVRIFPYEKHLIVYRAEDTGIFIIRVSHESMDITSKIAPHRMA